MKKKLSEMEEEDMDLDMREEEEVDRISNLPDSLIHQILSFLTTKQVAQTSVLSKRWSYLWITVPILDFKEPTDFLSLSEIQESGCVRPPSSLNRYDKFMDFVDGTLHRRHRAADIQKFAVSWLDHLNEHRVNSWITSAVRHNVQHLSLALCQKKPLIIARSLFTCESLISLKLLVYPDVRFPNCVSFPKLKCLKLDKVDFRNEYWNENHFSNCPVLEDLNMEHCTWFSMPNFCVSAPALNFFEIDNWDDGIFLRGEDDGLQGCTLKVHAPKLETFNYNGCVAKEYVLTTFPLLVRAVVQLNFKPYVATRDQRISHGAAISQLLRALANVKHLSVSDDTLQALFFADDLSKNLPTFQNTKELIMLEEVRAHTALVALLKATPNLESLVFDKPLPEEDDVAGSEADAAEDEDDDWTLNVVNDPECLFLHLKSVYFKEFTGNPMEMRWVLLILRYAKALETMSISNRNYSRLLNINTKSNEELMVEIPSLPRGSTSCVFKFPSW